MRKEQSTLAVIDDRWELWEAIAVKRNEKEETRGTSSSKNDEDTLRDEDDFREIYPSTKDATNPHRLRGTHLTWYLMYANYCADYRGYGNVNAELGAMVEILGGNAYPFHVSEEGKN